MKKLIFLIFVSFWCCLGQCQERVIVSDNPTFNTIVLGFSGYEIPATTKILSAQIEKANYKNGVYRNVVRLWHGKGDRDCINLVYQIFPTKEAAEEAQKDIIRTYNKYVLINWNAIEGHSLLIDLSNNSFNPIVTADFPLEENKKSHKKNEGDNSKETSFDFSFEGLQLNKNGYLEGVDEVSGINANYYSREKRIIHLKGTKDKAWVVLVPAPYRKGQALLFTAIKPNDHDVAGDKVRVTGSVSGLNAVEIINSVDIYIPKNWENLTRNDDGISWLTVQEYWCSAPGIPNEDQPQFRMTLGMLKKTGKGNRLFFDLKAQDLETTQRADGSWNEKYTTLYEFDDRNSKKFKIPFGKWFNLRTEILAGDENTGHFRLVATDCRGKETVIFDETCQTFASGYKKPGTKRPLYKSVSPLKLYTSARTLMAMNGHPLAIYFDNWNYKAVCIDE